MKNSILYNICVSIVKFCKPLIRFIADQADIALYSPRMPNGQHPLIFDDDLTTLKNNIPKSVYFNTRSGKIKVGKNTVFGEHVMVLTGKHNFLSDIQSMENLHEVPNDGREIEIGNNCYIGSGAIIIGPVKIGDFAVIGAGAVVTKNIEAFALVGGVPARKIKLLSFNNSIQ